MTPAVAIVAPKCMSRLSTLHIPDIGNLMTRCQMCLESIFGAEPGGDIFSNSTFLSGGTVPLTQVYFCYKSLEVRMSSSIYIEIIYTACTMH